MIDKPIAADFTVVIPTLGRQCPRDSVLAVVAVVDLLRGVAAGWNGHKATDSAATPQDSTASTPPHSRQPRR